MWWQSHEKNDLPKSFDDIKYESITLSSPNETTGEQRYKYNIYYKLQQLLAVTIPTAEEIKEIANVIRIEKQIYRLDKVLRSSNKLSSLLDEEKTEKLMEAIVNEMKILFGDGEYLSDVEALVRIYDSNYSNTIKDKMSYIHSNLRMMGYQDYCDMEIGILKAKIASPIEIKQKIKELKDIRKRFEDIGVSVASSNVSEVTKNINTLIEEQCLKTRKPRKKRSFATIREIPEKSGNTRFKCNPSIHLFDGSTKRPSVASSVGGTKEECEVKVFLEIKDIFQNNLKTVGNSDKGKVDCYEYCIQDLEAFKTVVESQKVIKLINSGILQIKQQLYKLQPKEISPWISDDLITNALENAE